MPTFYSNYFFAWPLTLGGPLDFAYPAYPIVTPLVMIDSSAAVVAELSWMFTKLIDSLL